MTETVKPTPWGDIHALLGPPAANGAMSTTLEDLGSIDADAISLEVADGTEYKLTDINGKVLDQLRFEPEISVKVTLVAPSETTRGKFWSTETVGAGETKKLRIKSLITSEKFSFKICNPKVVGSETFEAPYCSVSMKPIYSAQKGYTAECTIKLLNGQAGYLFDFGLVPEPTPEG